jgi:cation:H+ antiporter
LSDDDHGLAVLSQEHATTVPPLRSGEGGLIADPLLVLVFLAGAATSLAASWVLVSRLESLGARLGLTEALLGITAAVAADAPEITSSVTALIGHQARIGAGVAIGSNLFNLAALLGLGSLVAGRIALHRKVVAMDGTVVLWVSTMALLAVVGVISADVALALVLLLFLPYLVALSHRRRALERVGLPAAWVGWLESAVAEAEVEIEASMHQPVGHRRGPLEAGLAVLIVVGASVAMEQAASTFGARHGVPQVLTGGLVLAGITSLPNAVAGIYLARRGRGAATLSTSLNSNVINVAAGLLLPGAILGLGSPSGPGTLVAAGNVGLTGFVLAGAYRGRGLDRRLGAVILVGYAAFVVALILVA